MVTKAATTKDYSALAKSKIRKPKDRPLSVLVYGRNKKGKTTFCSTAPGKVLILDPENGTDHLTKANPDVWPIEKWSDLNEAYQFLRSGDHDYEYVAFDGMTRFSNMGLRFVMSQEEERDISRTPGRVQLQDYGKSGEIMKGLLYNLHSLGLGTIFTSQEKQIDTGEFQDEDVDVEDTSIQYVPDLPNGIRTVINSLVDVIGRIYTVRQETEKGTVIRRRLWLAPSPLYDTGFRSEFRLPDYLPSPTVPRLEQLIKNGKVTT